jgi:hypothetical protein
MTFTDGLPGLRRAGATPFFSNGYAGNDTHHSHHLLAVVQEGLAA